MRIPSNPIVPTVSIPQPTAVNVEAVKTTSPVVATLQTPARPLFTNMVADFGTFGISPRIMDGYETSEFIDLTRLKGHLPAEDVLLLVDYDSTTYNYESTDLVPAFTTVLTAGQSRAKVEPLTGGKLDQDDFNNYVAKGPENFKDTERFAIENNYMDTDERVQTVRVENLQQVMREILQSSDIEGTALSKPWEQATDFNVQDRIQEFTSSLLESKTLAEEFQELREKKAKERAHLDVSAHPAQPKPVDEDVPSLEILDPQEQALVQQLSMRDQEVRAHELAHKSVGGGLASAATFTYQQGPDGKQYAIGGEVQIQLSPGDTPEETLRRAQQVMSAATAPANPSAADLRAASMASNMEQEARAQQAQEQMEAAQEATIKAQKEAESVQAAQSEPLNGGRLPEEEITQLAAMEALEQQFKARDQKLEAPTELTLEREAERLTIAAPMGAYAQQFKLEQELDRRAFASLELAQEVAGVPTPQVVESRDMQAQRFEERIELNAQRRREVEVAPPRIDIQPSGSPDVEDARFTLTQDVQQSKDDLLEEQLNAMADPITEKEQQPQLQSFDGLNSMANDSSNAMPRSSEGLASEVSDLNPVVPQGVSSEDPWKLLKEAMDDDKARFSTLLASQVETQKEQRIPPMALSIEGNESSIEIEPVDSSTLFQPDHSQLDFSEEAITDGSMVAQSTMDTTGPTRLIPITEEDKRLQLTPQQKQSLETAQAVTALESMFGVQE